MYLSQNLIKAAGFSLVLMGTVTLFSCQNKNTTTPKSSTEAVQSDNSTSLKIAFVNLDTLEDKYVFFKDQKDAFEKRQASIEAQLNSSAQNLQNEYINFQKKAQSGTLTQAEGEAMQSRLENMQQNLEKQRDNLTSKLVSDQDAFNKKLKATLDSFLVEYNKDKKYDYIFSHMEGGGILFASPKYDITEDVVEGLNKAYKGEKGGKKAKTTERSSAAN